jgi:hypothetical protein
MKPTVEFNQVYYTPVVGQRAAVYITTPHPVLGEVPAPKWVHTSTVLLVEEDGSFETLNTLYKKV